MKIGKLAFRMLEKNCSVFGEADVKECGLETPDVTVFSGLCTELPAAAAANRGRSFCFVHLTYQVKPRDVCLALSFGPHQSEAFLKACRYTSAEQYLWLPSGGSVWTARRCSVCRFSLLASLRRSGSSHSPETHRVTW